MSPYRGLKMHERDDIIKYLVDSEQIIIDHAQTGGKPKKTYYSAEFVSVIEKEGKLK